MATETLTDEMTRDGARSARKVCAAAINAARAMNDDATPFVRVVA